ncbi:MAG: hypothetical protein JWL79_757 [Frankiales bacterium]|nr:hypothetical protein [Frankiales bacterium]
MRKSTKRIATLTSCGAAFALPLMVTGIASATTQPAPSNLVRLSNINTGTTMTVYSNTDNGISKAIGTAAGATGTLTGTAYGADSGATVVKVISRMGVPTSYNNSGGSGNYTYSNSGKTAEGVVITMTKTAGSTVIARYNANSDCGTYSDLYTNSIGGDQFLRTTSPTLSSTYGWQGQYCDVNGSGIYFAKGAAVNNGLPTSGAATMYSSSGTEAYVVNGVPVIGPYPYSYAGQCFNQRYYCND